MTDTAVTAIGPGGQIALPPDWVKDWGASAAVQLRRMPEGILIRPAGKLSWDEVFGPGLVVGSARTPANDDFENLEVTGDDLCY